MNGRLHQIYKRSSRFIMNNINFTSQKDESRRSPTRAILCNINLLQPIAHRISFSFHQGHLHKSSILKEST